MEKAPQDALEMAKEEDAKAKEAGQTPEIGLTIPCNVGAALIFHGRAMETLCSTALCFFTFHV